MPPSSISTLVLIVRFVVVRSTAPWGPASLGTTEELSRSIFSRTASPSLICGVSLMIVPTSSRWIVWKGVTELFAEPVLVN